MVHCRGNWRTQHLRLPNYLRENPGTQINDRITLIRPTDGRLSWCAKHNTLATATTIQLSSRHLHPSTTATTYENSPNPIIWSICEDILRERRRISVTTDGFDMSAREDHGVGSRFTAINGRDRPTMVVSMHRTDSNGAPRRSSPDERAKAQFVMPPPLKEKLSIATSTSPTHSEEWISPCGSERRHASTEAGPKLHKRPFSHRTRTGCVTCRRRKKKCDEARPQCKRPPSRDPPGLS